MSNDVYNRLTVVKGDAKEVLKFISEQEGVLEPCLLQPTRRLKFSSRTPNDPSIEEAMLIGFDTLWGPLTGEQVQTLLKKFPEYAFIYHLSDESGYSSDEEYHFLGGKLVKRTVLPNRFEEAEAEFEDELTLQAQIENIF